MSMDYENKELVTESYLLLHERQGIKLSHLKFGMWNFQSIFFNWLILTFLYISEVMVQNKIECPSNWLIPISLPYLKRSEIF